MSESLPDPEPSLPRLGRGASALVAALLLGALAVLLVFQMGAGGAIALGAALGAAVVAAAAWGPLAMGGAGAVSLGGAGAAGALAVVGGYVGAGLLAGGPGVLLGGAEPVIAVVFSAWIVLPVAVGVAVGFAALLRLTAR